MRSEPDGAFDYGYAHLWYGAFKASRSANASRDPLLQRDVTYAAQQALFFPEGSRLGPEEQGAQSQCYACFGLGDDWVDHILGLKADDLNRLSNSEIVRDLFLLDESV